jgi:hypothetical protein
MPLKVLLIDSDADRARALEEKLSRSGFAEVQRSPGGSGLAEAKLAQVVAEFLEQHGAGPAQARADRKRP